MFNNRTFSVVGVVTAAALALTLVTSAVASGTNATGNRSQVAHAYVDDLLPALDESIGWTGSIDGCDAGSIRPDAQAATRTAVNVMRELAGLDPVTFATKYNVKAQKAALVYAANTNVSHEIPKSWDCYSAAARAAGENSNIAYGLGGASAVEAYMADWGSNNVSVGHRRWILYPQATTMGSGSTEVANALWVLGDTADKGDYANPSWVSWPTAGYFPTQLEPDGRWSLAGDSTHSYDFSKAKVTVKNSAGTKLTVKVRTLHDGYGNDTLVWEVPGINAARGSVERTYAVKVTGIKRNGTTVSHAYSVTLFDPVAFLKAHPTS